MSDLLFITGNLKKAEQISHYLDFPVTHQSYDIEEIQSLDLEKIARHKARQAYQLAGQPVLVEDVSLVIPALGKLPGPLVKWFLEELGCAGILDLVSAEADRKALASVCFVFCNGETERAFTAANEGTLAMEPSGDRGFGFDPIFIPDGKTKTVAEMTLEEQAEVSMRRKALIGLHDWLRSHSNPTS